MRRQNQKHFTLVEVPPTRDMLRAMSNATFLVDGSCLEMERRFNGLLNVCTNTHSASYRRLMRVKRLIAAVADIDVRSALHRRGSRQRFVTVDVPVELVKAARREVDSWPETQAKRKR